MQSIPKSPSRSRGSILVVALVLSSIFLVIAVSLARTSSSEIKSAAASDDSIVAFEVAETGVEKALSQIYPTNSTFNTNAGHTTLNDFAGDISGSPSCTNGILEDTLADGRTYRLFVYDRTNNNPITNCTTNLKDPTVRHKILKVRAQGIYKNTVRAVDVTISDDTP